MDVAFPSRSKQPRCRGCHQVGPPWGPENKTNLRPRFEFHIFVNQMGFCILGIFVLVEFKLLAEDHRKSGQQKNFFGRRGGGVLCIPKNLRNFFYSHTKQLYFREGGVRYVDYQKQHYKKLFFTPPLNNYTSSTFCSLEWGDLAQTWFVFPGIFVLYLRRTRSFDISTIINGIPKPNIWNFFAYTWVQGLALACFKLTVELSESWTFACSFFPAASKTGR